MRKVVGKGARGVLSFLGGVGRRLPILGPIIEGLFTASDIKKLKKQFEMVNNIRRTAAKSG